MNPDSKNGRTSEILENIRAAVRRREITVDEFRDELNALLNPKDRVSYYTARCWIHPRSEDPKSITSESVLALQIWLERNQSVAIKKTTKR